MRVMYAGVRAPSCPVVTGKILAIQTRDPEHLKEIIHEEESNVAKVSVVFSVCQLFYSGYQLHTHARMHARTHAHTRTHTHTHT